MGRKTKLTKGLIKNAERLLKGGNYTETVCEYLGIGTTTWYRWLQEGEQASSGLKREFRDAVKKADSEAEIRLVTDLQKIAGENKQWQGIAWMLERKYPDKWGRKDRIAANIEHTGKNGGPIQTEQTINLSNLSDQELAVLEGILARSSESETS